MRTDGLEGLETILLSPKCTPRRLQRTVPNGPELLESQDASLCRTALGREANADPSFSSPVATVLHRARFVGLQIVSGSCNASKRGKIRNTYDQFISTEDAFVRFRACVSTKGSMQVTVVATTRLWVLPTSSRSMLQVKVPEEAIPTHLTRKVERSTIFVSSPRQRRTTALWMPLMRGEPDLRTFNDSTHDSEFQGSAGP